MSGSCTARCFHTDPYESLQQIGNKNIQFCIIALLLQSNTFTTNKNNMEGNTKQLQN